MQNKVKQSLNSQTRNIPPPDCRSELRERLERVQHGVLLLKSASPFIKMQRADDLSVMIFHLMKKIVSSVEEMQVKYIDMKTIIEGMNNADK